MRETRLVVGSVRRNITAHYHCRFHAVRCRAAVAALVIQLINDVLTIFRRYFDSQYRLSNRLLTLAYMNEQTGCNEILVKITVLLISTNTNDDNSCCLLIRNDSKIYVCDNFLKEGEKVRFLSNL